MKRPLELISLSTLAFATATLVAGAPAQAAATPVSSSISAQSSNANLTDESNGLRVRCPRANSTGRISADGRSASVGGTFTSGGGVTCTESLFGSSVTVGCVGGGVTLRSSSSVAGTSASGTIFLDSGFACNVSPAIGSGRTIRGPQSPSNCTFTYTQASRSTRIDCRTIAVDGGGESGFAATYTVDQFLTIS